MNSHTDGHLMKPDFVMKYRVLLTGLIIFSAGLAIYLVSAYNLTIMNQCKNDNWSNFIPGTKVETSCLVTQDIGQDLTFRAVFKSADGTSTIQIPAHVEIRDPNGIELMNKDTLDEKIVMSFHPKVFGKYTATLTSREDGDDRMYKGYTNVEYALGYLVGYPEVPNNLGTALVYMFPIGNVLFLAGIGVVVYGIVKVVRKRS